MGAHRLNFSECICSQYCSFGLECSKLKKRLESFKLSYVSYGLCLEWEVSGQWIHEQWIHRCCVDTGLEQKAASRTTEQEKMYLELK